MNTDGSAKQKVLKISSKTKNTFQRLLCADKRNWDHPLQMTGHHSMSLPQLHFDFIEKDKQARKFILPRVNGTTTIDNK